ncbi:MAG: hypothetical protein ONB37_17260 [candidate division KSB1 bacterium]|nr:hypothetical protein [candidate division KSB1 bacterium]
MSRKLTFLLAAVLCTAAFAQEKPLPSFLIPKKDTTKSKQKTDQPIAPPSVLILEDIFGRLYDGAMLSQNYQRDQYKLISTGTDGQKYRETFDYHNFLLSGGYGRRDKYQVSSSINLTGQDLDNRNTNRNFNLNFIYLPGNAWQIYNRIATHDHAQSDFKDNFSWDGSLLYLSGGQVSLFANKFPHFLFFRDMLLEPQQLWFSFDPGYSYQRYNWSNSSDVNKATYLPLFFRYGLSDWLNMRVALQYNAEKDSDDYPILSIGPSENEQIGTGNQKQRMENLNSDIGLSLIPDRRFLFDGSVNFNHQEETYSSTSRYFSGTEEYFKSVDKRDGYAVHLRANYLSIRRTLSAVDYRRSFHNGIYLKQAELKNQLHWTSYSKNYDPNLKWSLYDALDLGLTDHINLFLNAEYSRVREKAENDNDKSTWNYSSGLTFYNLNFSGDELNDFDYFYGRIVQPKDYITTLKWMQSHRGSSIKSNHIGFKTGLLTNMDVSLL